MIEAPSHRAITPVDSNTIDVQSLFWMKDEMTNFVGNGEPLPVWMMQGVHANHDLASGVVKQKAGDIVVRRRPPQNDIQVAGHTLNINRSVRDPA
jgi:hypothetical protein